MSDNEEPQSGENKPPAQKITNSDIADVIRTADMPVLTASDIGDELGVVDETIRARIDSVVSEYDDIKRGKVDRATVYWLGVSETTISITKANLAQSELANADEMLREGKPVLAYEHVQKARQALEEGIHE